MQDLTGLIVARLRKYMRDPGQRVASAAALSDLGIESVDLPLVLLDLEDAFNVEMDCGVDPAQPMIVRDVVTRLATSLRAKSRNPRRLTFITRAEGWMSTGTKRRRASR